jgi:hypothetical protein
VAAQPDLAYLAVMKKNLAFRVTTQAVDVLRLDIGLVFLRPCGSNFLPLGVVVGEGSQVGSTFVTGQSAECNYLRHRLSLVFLQPEAGGKLVITRSSP